ARAIFAEYIELQVPGFRRGRNRRDNRGGCEQSDGGGGQQANRSHRRTGILWRRCGARYRAFASHLILPGFRHRGNRSRGAAVLTLSTYYLLALRWLTPMKLSTRLLGTSYRFRSV